jgi:hypothetical protein
MKKKHQHTLVIIDDKFISGELLDELFACDISKCKGECCVGGDYGAPLEETELRILEEIYPKVEPYMVEAGKEAILEQGKYVVHKSGAYVTPLVKGRECAYVYFDKGIALCAIEKAWAEGKIDFQKPISCHLYPVRVKKSRTMEALNYDRWDICGAACVSGKEKGVRVYEFVKDALIRKYGADFYQQLDEAVKAEEAENKA